MKQFMYLVFAVVILITGCATMQKLAGDPGPLTQKVNKLTLLSGEAKNSLWSAYECVGGLASNKNHMIEFKKRMETAKTDEEKEAIKKEYIEVCKSETKNIDVEKKLDKSQQQILDNTLSNLMVAIKFNKYIAQEVPVLMEEAQKVRAIASNPMLALKYKGDLPQIPRLLNELPILMKNATEQPIAITALINPLTKLALANGLEPPKTEKTASDVEKDTNKGMFNNN